VLAPGRLSGELRLYERSVRAVGPELGVRKRNRDRDGNRDGNRDRNRHRDGSEVVRGGRLHHERDGLLPPNELDERDLRGGRDVRSSGPHRV
jgi:hypothetical protein